MSPCDNCGSAAPDNTYKSIGDGEKFCSRCCETLDFTTGDAIRQIREELDPIALSQLDKAFGLIKENLPQYFIASNMLHLQIVTTKKLSG